jgi:hypothetical protein
MIKKLGAIAFLLVAGIMAFTNPDRQEYINYASQHFIREVTKALCDSSQLEKIFKFSDKNLTNLCKSGLGVGLKFSQETVKQFIDRNSTSQNFIIFSIYTTNLLDDEYKTAGIFNNFITFKFK